MIQMVRGYSQPPSSGAAMYHGFGQLVNDGAVQPARLSSQFGYTYVTQEGEGHSEPHEDAFQPVEHWNGFVPMQTPGPLGGCAGGCGCAGNCGSSMGGFGEDGQSNFTMLAIGAAVVGFLMLRKKKRRSRR